MYYRLRDFSSFNFDSPLTSVRLHEVGTTYQIDEVYVPLRHGYLIKNPSYSLHSSAQLPSLSLDHADLLTSKRACLLVIEIWNVPLYGQDIVLMHFKLAS